jgi:hypothetical protein
LVSDIPAGDGKIIYLFYSVEGALIYLSLLLIVCALYSVQVQLKGRNILPLIFIRFSMHSSCPIENSSYLPLLLIGCSANRRIQYEDFMLKPLFGQPIGGLESHSVLLIGCPAEKANRWYVIIIVLQKM